MSHSNAIGTTDIVSDLRDFVDAINMAVSLSSVGGQEEVFRNNKTSFPVCVAWGRLKHNLVGDYAYERELTESLKSRILRHSPYNNLTELVRACVNDYGTDDDPPSS